MKGSNTKIFQKLEQVFAELRHHRQPKNTMTSCMQASANGSRRIFVLQKRNLRTVASSRSVRAPTDTPRRFSILQAPSLPAGSAETRLTAYCQHYKLTANTTMQTLGQKIRELREAKDISLREFAKKLGDLSASFVSDVELGRRFPSDKVFAKMAHALGVTVDELKKHDTRPPLDELKRMAASDPTFGFALRSVIEKKVSADDLMNLAKKSDQKKK